MDRGDPRPVAVGPVRAYDRRHRDRGRDLHPVPRGPFEAALHLPGRVTAEPKTLFPDDAEPGHSGHRQRLRDRFMNGGADALPDYELLELVLFSAIPRRDTKPLAKQLIARFGDFAGVISALPSQLALEGLSENTIATLKLIQAGAVRLGRQRVMTQPVLSSWSALTEY